VMRDGRQIHLERINAIIDLQYFAGQARATAGALRAFETELRRQVERQAQRRGR
jgi:hypothetical protein